MRQYVIKRCIGIIPLLLGISFLSFILINLSDSDPAEVALRVNAITPTEEAVEQMRKELGLDKPFFKRYVTWLGKSVQGDFGISYVTNKPVLLEMKQAIPATLLLAFTSLIIIFFQLAFSSLSYARFMKEVFSIALSVVLFL